MAELSQMMNDMALLVEQDQDKINQIEKNTAAVEVDTEKAYVLHLPCLTECLRFPV